eukprot:536882_1
MMDEKELIECFRILNAAEDDSTCAIDAFPFIETINKESFIISDCDEELIILIKFREKISLNSLAIWAYPNTEVTDQHDASPPKAVFVYKLKNLSVDFNDLPSMKADIAIKCSSKKLRKGQSINFKKNPKIAVKFKDVQFMAVYIKSNQKDTELTYLNGIKFKRTAQGAKHGKFLIDDKNDYHFDSSDVQQMNKLNDIVTELNQLEAEQDVLFMDQLYDKLAIGYQSLDRLHEMNEHVNNNKVDLKPYFEENEYDSDAVKADLQDIDASNIQLIVDNQLVIELLQTICQNEQGYLREQSNIYGNTSKCVLNKCQSINRLSQVLCFYRRYIDTISAAVPTYQQQVYDTQIGNIYEVIDDNYNNEELVNDFIHLLFEHSAQFEDIHDILMRDNKPCDVTNCIMLRRNRRDRGVYLGESNTLSNLYFNNDVIMQQLMDKIHSYFFHSFDIGYRLTRREKDAIQAAIPTVDERKLHDETFLQINNIIHKKNKENKICNNITDNNKFMLVNDQVDQKFDIYSFGHRYFYWKHYKNNQNVFDDAHCMANQQGHLRPEANPGFTLAYWYISRKYTDFKTELLNNNIWHIGSAQFIHLWTKALVHMRTDEAKSIQCRRQEEYAKCYEMKSDQKVQLQHLMAMMVYCNFDLLQRKFTETFRYKDKYETDVQLKKRHGNYYFLGRYLREMAECFGMKYGDVKSKELSLYHGVNKRFTFTSLDACINGPFSTTLNYNVALNFCQNMGLILELSMVKSEWRFNYHFANYYTGFSNYFESLSYLNCVDCSWLSDYPNEQEVFCIGGLGKFHFSTIIEPPTTNYQYYVRGLKQATWFMTYGDQQIDTKSCVTTYAERQMIFRLLSHELWRYFPNHQHAHEWKQCPNFIKELLHNHCQSIRVIHFPWKEILIDVGDGIRAHYDVTEHSAVQERLFKYDNEWIKLNLIMKLFPNTGYIVYDGPQDEVDFYQQNSIYNSLLQYIKIQSQTNLEQISFEFNPKYEEEMTKYIIKFKKDFEKYGWKICIHVIANHHEGTVDGLGLELGLNQLLGWDDSDMEANIASLSRSTHVMIVKAAVKRSAMMNK